MNTYVPTPLLEKLDIITVTGRDIREALPCPAWYNTILVSLWGTSALNMVFYDLYFYCIVFFCDLTVGTWCNSIYILAICMRYCFAF